MTKESVLIVEDDEDILQLLDYNFRSAGVEVATAGDGLDALAKIRRQRPDLVLLDIMLPGADGFEVCKNIKRDPKTAQVPVIMLTARGEEVDRIVGLELGADDYLPKPFNPRELAARIRAVLRRYEQRPQAALALVEVNGVKLDPGTREVFAYGKRVELTTFEFDILEMLMRSAGHVLSRDRLMENFYNRKATPFDRSIDMHISHLRKKIEQGATLIKTIRGIGYQFCRTPEDVRSE